MTKKFVIERSRNLQSRLGCFFGRNYDLSLFREILENYGRKQVEDWEATGLKIGFLPREEMKQDAKFPGWQVRPEQWFYDRLRAGQLYRRNSRGELVVDKKADELERGTVVLFDTRCKPAFQQGRQMWQGDESFLGPLIAGLRKEGNLRGYQYGPADSRFGVSGDEWQNHLRPAVAKFLGLEAKRVRLERVVEFSVLSQLYPNLPRAKDGQTNTWLLLEECCVEETLAWAVECYEDGSVRLGGGSSLDGGLADVDWIGSATHGEYISLRPLIVLAGPVAVLTGLR